MCYKTNYIAIREQFEWLKDFEAKEQKTSKDQNGQGAMTLKRAATKCSRYNDFNDQEDEDLEIQPDRSNIRDENILGSADEKDSNSIQSQI